MRAVALTVFFLAFVATAPAWATGGDEPGEMDEAMASAPARVLAQQALATLDVNGDVAEARERIDAALESKDRHDVDVELLGAADEALDAGNTEEALTLLNRALGGGPVPVGEGVEGGSVSEEALHNAGRAYAPNETTQEVVALVAGLALGLAAVLLLAPQRRRRSRSRSAS